MLQLHNNYDAGGRFAELAIYSQGGAPLGLSAANNIQTNWEIGS